MRKDLFQCSNRPQKGIQCLRCQNRILFDFPKRPKGIEQPIVIGIPRVLNMFEDYPFWHTLFTECGFRVVLSPESNFALYQAWSGICHVRHICFPAKIAHGHILALVDQGVDRIFYPIVPKETKEFASSSNSYNCPVVSGYPDVIRSSMNPAERFGIPFDKPVIPFHNRHALEKACRAYLETLGDFSYALQACFYPSTGHSQSAQQRADSTSTSPLRTAVGEGKLVFVVTGRPTMPIH